MTHRAHPRRTLLRLALSTGLAGLSAGAWSQTFVPPDAAALCTVAPASFKQWFGGAVTPNGFVRPANGLSFNHSTINPPSSNKTINCNFYQWSQQMFLWLSSPAPAFYGGGGRVFDSPVFFDVQEGDGKDEQLCLVNAVLRMNSCGGGAVAPRFSNRVNRVPKALPLLRSNGNASVDQADGSAVLMARDGRLVYYTKHVNDVYAYYASALGTSNEKLLFPTTAAELQTALDWARRHGRLVPDPEALAVELKLSWVEAQPGDIGRYVLMAGEIPVFDKGAQKWSQTSSRQALLALVGMHVVGSVAGHPEMIWATFEHENNTPNAAYAYVNRRGQTIALGAEPPKQMLFAPDGYAGPYNQMRMKAGPPTSDGGATIVATGAQGIGPSATQRTFPWGTSPVIPLLQGLNAAQANTEVIAINNSVRAQLAPGDLRRRYLFIGATWTVGGMNPSVPFPNPPSPNAFNQAGTSTLANSTMETYVNLQNKLYNCFSCHSTGQPTNQTATVGVSHIYNSLVPFGNALGSLRPASGPADGGGGEKR